MRLRPCPFCSKPIPSRMNTCPYCHRDEEGKPVSMDSLAPAADDMTREIAQDLEQLVSGDAYLQAQAALRLEQKNFSATPALLLVLEAHTSPCLPTIAKILGRVGDKRAIVPLTQAVRSGDDSLRMAALWALAQFREPEVLPVLLAEAERPHPVTQSFLASVLGHFQDLKAIPVLGRLTRHPSPEVAYHAASALGELHSPQAVQALQRAIRRRDPIVRAAAGSALRRQGVSPVLSSGIFQWGSLALLALVGVGLSLWWFYR